MGIKQTRIQGPTFACGGNFPFLLPSPQATGSHRWHWPLTLSTVLVWEWLQSQAGADCQGWQGIHSQRVVALEVGLGIQTPLNFIAHILVPGRLWEPQAHAFTRAERLPLSASPSAPGESSMIKPKWN